MNLSLRKRGDINVNVLGTMPSTAVICYRSKVRGVWMERRVEGNNGPATALEVAGGDEGFFCVCG